MATLEDVIRSVRQEDFADPKLGAALAPLLRQTNNAFGALINAVAGDITLSENVRCDVVTARFTHDVPQTVKLTKLRSAKSAVVLSCNGAISVATPTVIDGPDPRVTLYFNDTAATNIPCTIALFPEGVGQASSPAYTSSSGGSVITTEGDLIVGDVAGNESRLPIGAPGAVLTSDGTTASWVVGGAGTVLKQGAGTIDFGVFPGSSEATLAVVDATVTADCKAWGWITGGANAGHTLSDHLYAQQLLGVTVVPNAGVGLDVYARCLDKMQGSFLIEWAYYEF